MGNVSNKDITKSDICFDYFAKTLIEKYNRKEKRIYNLLELKDCNLKDEIIKYKNMICLCLQPSNNKEYNEFQKEMIKPFVNQLCITQKFDFLDSDYVNNSLSNPYIIMIGFSQGNVCKLVSYCSINFKKNIFTKEIMPEIELLCATTVKTEQNLSNAGKKYKHLFRVNEFGITEIKAGLGVLTLYFAYKLCLSLNYKTIILNTTPDLFKYYKNKSWKIGYPNSDVGQEFVTGRSFNFVSFSDMLTNRLFDYIIQNNLIDCINRKEECLIKAEELGFALFMKNTKAENTDDNYYLLHQPLNYNILQKYEGLLKETLFDLDFISGITDLFDLNSTEKNSFVKNWTKNNESYGFFIDYTDVKQDHRNYNI